MKTTSLSANQPNQRSSFANTGSPRQGDADENKATADPPTAVLVGTAVALLQVQRQISLLDTTVQPTVIGAIVLDDQGPIATRELTAAGIRPLGLVSDLESIVDDVRPQLALVSLPSSMSHAITAIRTRLRKMGVPDRFMATLEDQMLGVGPRSHFEISEDALTGRSPIEIDEKAIIDTIRGKRVLITGAGGSIGSELSRICAAYEPAALFLMDRSENALFEIDRQIARKHPDLTRGAWLHDVTDTEKTLAYCEAAKPEIIFHAAAHKHVPMMEDHPALAVRNNFFGTKSIADAAAITGCKRFVMISTDKAVNPSSIMGATKRLAELYIQHLNAVRSTTFEIVRFGNVLGSAGSVLTIWDHQIKEGGPITVTHPEMTRYFMTIPEAASLVVQAAALDHLQGGDIAVLDMGEPLSILEMAKRFVELHGLGWTLNDSQAAQSAQMDESAFSHSCERIPIVCTGIRPGEKLHEELVYRHENMVRSPHPGIRVWKGNAPSAELVGDMVATLVDACQIGTSTVVSTAIARLIPEMQVATRFGRASDKLNVETPDIHTTPALTDTLCRPGTTAKLKSPKVA